MMKKAISIFLCIFMLISVVPLTAFAEEATVSTYQQLWQAIYSKKESITLNNDITYKIEDGGNQALTPATYLNNIGESVSITIDLNGHTLSVTNESKTYPQNSALFKVYDDASLSVYNGTVTLYNKYVYDNLTDRTLGGVFHASGNAYLTLTGVNVNVRSNGPGIKTGENATVTIEGGEITAGNGFALYDESSSSAGIFLDKNVKLKTIDGGGVPTQFSITGYGSAHITTPNLSIISATFTSGIEASEEAITAFAPSSGKYLFVENKEYTNAFSTSNSGDYYWYNCTGGYALIESGNGNLAFADNVQILSKTAKNYVTVKNGTASPNYATYGQTVTVTASKISGKAFAYWVNPSANIAFDNAWSETTTFTMGADAVEIEAIYDKVLTPVTNAKINVKTPTGGQTLSVPTSASDIFTIDEYYWIEVYEDDSFSNVLPDNTVFQSGHRYKLFVVLNWDSTEYSVDENTKIKFFDSEKNTSIDTEEGVTKQIRFGIFTAEAPEEINSLSATVSGIKAGATTGSTTVTPESSDYFTTIYGWYDTDNAFSVGSTNRMTASDKFEGGKTYVVAVRFLPNGEKVLASNLDALINGKDGMIGSFDGNARIFYVTITVPENKNGFIEENDNVYYYKNNQKVTGWFTDNGKKYYADSDGIVQFGWTDIDGKRYYLDEAEGYAVTGLNEIYGEKYYFDENGVMIKGFKVISGKTYYFDTDGIMLIGWQVVNNNWYYFGDDGVMRTGLQKLSNNYFLFNSNGVMQTGFKTVNGKKYYFNEDGVRLSDWQWIKNSKGVSYRYYFGDDGVMRTGWQNIKASNGKTYRYYFHTNGVMLTGWQKIKNSKGVAYQYYFHTNGVMLTGWQNIKNSKGVAYKYYFHTNGVMLTGWQTIKNSKGVGYKYYFGTNGVMRTGWQWIANSKGVKYRYYFGANGYMRTGWQKIAASNGKNYWYYFYSNGVNVINKNVKIGSKTYKFNKYGICTNP